MVCSIALLNWMLLMMSTIMLLMLTTTVLLMVMMTMFCMLPYYNTTLPKVNGQTRKVEAGQGSAVLARQQRPKKGGSKLKLNRQEHTCLEWSATAIKVSWQSVTVWIGHGLSLCAVSALVLIDCSCKMCGHYFQNNTTWCSSWTNWHTVVFWFKNTLFYSKKYLPLSLGSKVNS